jgi:hypothetical protein
MMRELIPLTPINFRSSPRKWESKSGWLVSLSVPMVTPFAGASGQANRLDASRNKS